jgi:hypothetical protein
VSRVDILPDRAQHVAHHIVTRAIDDEIAHLGTVCITETLAVYLEHRVASALRPLFEENKKERFDA